MLLVSRLFWPLAGLLTCLGVVVSAAGELEVGLVFPRENETYAPMKNFPVVFAVRNPKATEHLQLSIYSFIRNGTYLQDAVGHSDRSLAGANFTTDPYFVSHYVDLDTEGPHMLFAAVSWEYCGKPFRYRGELVDQLGFVSNTINIGATFTIKKGAQEVDLVAATASGKNCTARSGFAITVSDKTHEVEAYAEMPAGTCAVLASPSPTLSAEACRVKLDAATTSSMAAEWHDIMCGWAEWLRPADCPKDEENSVAQLAVAGVASLAAALGAIGFLLLA
ncbi:hypothetical protein VTH06DRAFT_1464 [Thermothelomyces fergusii]